MKMRNEIDFTTQTSRNYNATKAPLLCKEGCIAR